MALPAHRQITVEPPKDGFEIGAFMVTQRPAWAEYDWEDAQGWLVARWHDRVVGAVQVLFGKPMGRIEVLSVAESLGDVQRSVVVLGLLNTAADYLRHAGVQLAMGTIPEELDAYAKMVERRGIPVVARGSVIQWRLQ